MNHSFLKAVKVAKHRRFVITDCIETDTNKPTINKITVVAIMPCDEKQTNSTHNKRIPRPWILFVFSVVLWVEQASLAGAFVQTTLSPGSAQSGFFPESITASSRSKLSEPSCSTSRHRSRSQSTQLFSFMGSDGGLFGIGTPELVS